jgi:predicted esterase
MRIEFRHRFVPGATASSPTLLALHGTGGDENDLIPLARMVSPDAAIVSPRGRVLEHGMPRFFRRLAEGVFDQEDLRIRTTELAEFIGEAATQYGFDPARVIAIGYSNGANIAASVMLSNREALAGAVLLRPMVPFEPAAVPDLRSKRVLISAGREDTIVPRELTTRLGQLLEQGGADVTVSWFDAGHSLVPLELEQAASWFHSRFAS